MDKALAIAQFFDRRIQHKGKRIDNSSLYAGSSMHYYCRHCHAPTETLPETHRERPNTVCVPCHALEDLGFMPDAKKAFESWLALSREGSRMNDDEYRSKLKLEMLLSLNPDACTQTLCESTERVLGLIKSDEADLLLITSGSNEPTQRYAIRFNDRDLGVRAREDCLDLYGLR